MSEPQSIQWFPGHMTKTRRMMEEDLKLVDAVCEILDARIPMASRNPDIDELVGSKPRLIILNRADQADPAMNKMWGDYFRGKGFAVLETDANSGKGVGQFSPMVRNLLKDQIAAWAAKGLVGRKVRAMVVGVPNVGKTDSFAGYSCVVPDAGSIANLLNQYFCTYTGPIDVSEMNLVTDEWPHGSASTDANVQYMGRIDKESDDAILNGDTDLDGAVTTDGQAAGSAN